MKSADGSPQPRPPRGTDTPPPSRATGFPEQTGNAWGVGVAPAAGSGPIKAKKRSKSASVDGVSETDVDGSAANFPSRKKNVSKIMEGQSRSTQTAAARLRAKEVSFGRAEVLPTESQEERMLRLAIEASLQDQQRQEQRQQENGSADAFPLFSAATKMPPSALKTPFVGRAGQNCPCPFTAMSESGDEDMDEDMKMAIALSLHEVGDGAAVFRPRFHDGDGSKCDATLHGNKRWSSMKAVDEHEREEVEKITRETKDEEENVKTPPARIHKWEQLLDEDMKMAIALSLQEVRRAGVEGRDPCHMSAAAASAHRSPASSVANDGNSMERDAGDDERKPSAKTGEEDKYGDGRRSEDANMDTRKPPARTKKGEEKDYAEDCFLREVSQTFDDMGQSPELGHGAVLETRGSNGDGGDSSERLVKALYRAELSGHDVSPAEAAAEAASLAPVLQQEEAWEGAKR